LSSSALFSGSLQNTIQYQYSWSVQTLRAHSNKARTAKQKPLLLVLLNPLNFWHRPKLSLISPGEKHTGCFSSVAIEGTISTNHFVCTSLDISLAGMLIETIQTFKQGDWLSCSFFLPNMKQIQLTGEIIRTIQPVPGVDANWYGVHFLNLPPDAAKILEALIDTNASKSHAGRGVQPA
jgi:hypothetical protein